MLGVYGMHSAAACGWTSPAALDRTSLAGLGLYRSSFPSSQRGKHFKGATMYSRIVNCTIDPAKVGEFKAARNNELLPRIQAQPGLIDKIKSLDPATGRLSSMSLWYSAVDVENYDK